MKLDRRPIKVKELEDYFRQPQQNLYKMLHRSGIHSSKLMPEDLIKEMYRVGHFKGFKLGSMWHKIRRHMEKFLDAVVDAGWLTPEQAEHIRENTEPPTTPVLEVEKPKRKSNRGRPKATPEPDGEGGIDAAVKRLRSAEKRLHGLWLKSLSVEKPNLAEADRIFKQWQNSIESLRKGEDTLQQLQVKRGKLLDADTVREFYKARVLPVKSRLRRMPNRLAPILEGEDALVIRRELESAIHKALESFAEDLYEEKEVGE